MSEFIGNRIVPKHCGVWSGTVAYEPLSIVLDNDTGDSYISRKDVPAGTGLAQSTYWAQCGVFSEQVEKLREDTAVSVSEMEKRTSAAEELTNSNKAALESLVLSTKATLEKRMDTIESRQDANVTASTDSNADYAAEVVDARIGWDEQSYGSLGAAIRGLAGQSLKYGGILYRNKGTDDLNDLEVNTFYLVSSSSGDTTLVNYPEYSTHGLIITVGGAKDFIYQIFYGGRGDRIFLRYHIESDGWHDWVDLLEGTDAEFDTLYKMLFHFGVVDILHRSGTFGGTVSSGVTFTANDDGSITADGTVADGGIALYNMILTTQSWPDGIEPGKSYVFHLEGDTENVLIQGFANMSQDGTEWKRFVSTNSAAEATVPEDSYGILIRLCINSGLTVENATVYPSVTRNYTAEEYYQKVQEEAETHLKFAGSLQRTTGTENLDELAANTIYLVSSGTGDTTLVNYPEDYNGTSAIITMGAEGGFTYQMVVTPKAGKQYLRYRYKTGIWDDWNNIAEITIDTDGFRGTNPNSHMLSYGNSILSGSVWLDGKYNHLSAYYNAPYGNIANAIGIPKDNVNHTVVSSTGLLYDAGNGSFLENIKTNDLSGYDVVLTHLWTADMNKYQVGTVDAQADDGTIAGGVVSLLEYMKESNGQCQLILVGVPPVSSTIYGEGVFSTAYPNGSTIEELDVVMHEMAEKYHFVYIDWQGLNLSYYYHNYSDDTNVHANNEDTYRAMGGYLGGRAAAQIRF